MKRRTTLLVSSLAAATAIAGISGGLAIASTSSAKERTVPAVTAPVLLTLAGDEATIDPIPGTDRFRLRIQGTQNDLTWFTDDPVRRVGHMRADDLASEWSRVFGEKPPLTALTLRNDGQTFTYIVEATRMTYENGVLALSIEPVTAALGALPSKADEVMALIDDAYATLPRDPEDHPVVLRDVVSGSQDRRPVQVRDSISTDQPPTDWVFHSIIQPSDSHKYIGKAGIDQSGTGPSDDFIYSMPATALIADYTDHHLDVVDTGVYLVDHPTIQDATDGS